MMSSECLRLPNMIFGPSEDSGHKSWDDNPSFQTLAFKVTIQTVGSYTSMSSGNVSWPALSVKES